MPATPDSKVYRPRNPEATKELLLASAGEEFAEHGYAGARIDRIADGAHTNKRMIYAYFGDKDGLFSAVLERQIGSLVQAVPLIDGDLVGFAAARFDYMLANPKARRLAAWRTFERAEPTAAERESYRARVDSVAAAQRAGKLTSDIPAVDLFALVLRMTESWLSAPPGMRSAADGDPQSKERLEEHRAALVLAVRRLVEPTPQNP
ncbi:TetR family transcriptional regulator [Saccharopolyspora sp. K220]|uniref:TetR family transcriptional regulator n=1 Tax=Saccharopolyspora soli TaxID=2926618 RepID=UPI001F591CA2|nr:TetR family transcriptional regulator [Saccharopolyspora soli]MCI2415793.1 TetR family transcriptional regulator [Saccharopolyspora soli]